jgi:hypothetical protein
MSAPLNMYVFRDGPFAPSGDTLVCVGERIAVEAHLGLGQLQILFRGAAVYTHDETKLDYIGVWGARNGSRVRRLLREHGAKLMVHAEPPPGTRLRFFSAAGKASSCAN